MRATKPKGPDAEVREEMHEATTPGARGGEKEGDEMAERKHGGRMKRRAGGHVPGKEPKHRVDRRARGGATSDANPMTAAGKMSVPDYEHAMPGPNGGGEGKDNAGPRAERG